MKSWQIGIIVGVVLLAVAGGGALFISNSADPAAATVNGVAVSETEVETQLTAIKEQQPQLFEGEAGKEQEDRYREQILTFLINAELIKQEAERVGIKVSDKDINDRLKEVRDLFPDKSQFEQALQEQNLNEEGLKEQIHEQLVSDQMMERVTKDIKITSKDRQDYYDQNTEQFVEPEQRRWSQIMVSKKADADKLLKEINEGADFSETAKSDSEDEQSAPNGGDIGWAGVSDFPPEISEAIDGLEIGEVSEVIASGDDAFLIFKYEEFKEEKQLEFSEVKDQIGEILKSNEQQEKFSELIERLNKEATITKA